ncbi:MAG: hypothetical protein GY941_23610 [Planctomycetes bacterium]|nr:hypothetical protein [Planctomycetota bacterium]
MEEFEPVKYLNETRAPTIIYIGLRGPEYIIGASGELYDRLDGENSKRYIAETPTNNNERLTTWHKLDYTESID